MALAQPSVRVQPQSVHRFDAVDLTWELVSEAAVRAYRAGGVDGALIHWQRALTIARERFEPGDPRLATSLANCAYALRQRNETYESQHHFAQAERVLAESWRWVRRMSPAGQQQERFDEAALASFLQLVARLRSAIRAIEAHDEIPLGQLERWKLERPLRGCDARRLLAGCLLLISRRSPAPA